MDYWNNLINTILIFSILGISLNLIMGFGGMISLAHAVYFGLSAYIVAILSVSGAAAPIPPSLIAIVATGVFAAITAFPALRVRDEYLILLTLAIQMIASGIMESWLAMTNGPSGIPGIPPLEIFGRAFFTPTDMLPLIVGITVVVFLFARRLGNSAYGRVLKALRESESATESLGKNVVLQKVVLFGISGSLAGLAGALFARGQGFINPASFDLDTSILIIAVVALGGVANLYGTLAGAVLVLGLPELLTFLDVGSTDTVSAARGIVFGLLLLVFSRFRPQGIIPEHATLWRRASRITTDRVGLGATEGRAATPKGHFSHESRPALRARNLSKRFGGIVTAEKVDFTLDKGKVTVLLGPNGAGKTTMFNLLTGTLKPDAGEVSLHGKTISGLSAFRRVRAGLTRSFQDVRLFENLSVIDNVRVAIPGQAGENLFNLFLRPRHTKKDAIQSEKDARGLLARVGLDDKAGEIARDLSYGEQKLLALARLLATRADVLLFDEPAAGVDDKWKHRMLRLIKDLAATGIAVCLVEHNISIVREVADEVYFMDAGSIIAKGPVEQIMADPNLSELYFGKLSSAAGQETQ